MRSPDRSIRDAEKNFNAGRPLSYNNILGMVDAFIGDAASMVSALTSFLLKILNKVRQGGEVHYIDKHDTEKVICRDNFEEFVLETFDEFILKCVYEKDQKNR